MESLIDCRCTLETEEIFLIKTVYPEPMQKKRQSNSTIKTLRVHFQILRVEGGGDSEERGFQELLIKDTWTKPMGRVEAREGGRFG